MSGWRQDGEALAPFLAEFEAYFRGPAATLHAAARSAQGTAFQQAVWRALCDIPTGRPAAAGDIARAIGKPSAVRAVGPRNGPQSAVHHHPPAIA